MPTPAVITSTTHPAIRRARRPTTTFPLDLGALHAGTNVLAVEMHQGEHHAAADISFDLQAGGHAPRRHGGTGIPLTPGHQPHGRADVRRPQRHGQQARRRLHRHLVRSAHRAGRRRRRRWPIRPGLAANPHMNLVAPQQLPARRADHRPRAEIVDEQDRVDRDVWNATVTLTVDDNPNIVLSATRSRSTTAWAARWSCTWNDRQRPVHAHRHLGRQPDDAARRMTSLDGTPQTTISGTLSGSTARLERHRPRHRQRHRAHRRHADGPAGHAGVDRRRHLGHGRRRPSTCRAASSRWAPRPPRSPSPRPPTAPRWPGARSTTPTPRRRSTSTPRSCAPAAPGARDTPAPARRCSVEQLDHHLRPQLDQRQRRQDHAVVRRIEPHRSATASWPARSWARRSQSTALLFENSFIEDNAQRRRRRRHLPARPAGRPDHRAPRRRAWPASTTTASTPWARPC